MPIYMDRHDVSETVTAEIVAQLHQQDLKIQQKFNCRGLTYWFDEKRKTAFCLIEAPNKKTIKAMHNQAHGEVPHRIIEVDSNVVESFLGRIEDPQRSQNTGLNIINDPAFRTIMVIRLEIFSIKRYGSTQINLSLQKYNKSIVKILDHFNGSIVKQNENYFLVSFKSVSKAILCAIAIRSKIKILNDKIGSNIIFKIGLSAGSPITNKGTLFEDSIRLAERICNNAKGEIIASSEVKDLYKSENLKVFFDIDQVLVLTPSDEKFLNLLSDYLEKVWRNTKLNVDDFNKQLGFSKSQLYRKMISITGKSPNNFLKDYRLNEALKLLKKQPVNISEIAFETGFNSLSYFSKCFQKRYGCLPSKYLHSKYL